jgi:hypothetical protein
VRLGTGTETPAQFLVTAACRVVAQCAYCRKTQRLDEERLPDGWVIRAAELFCPLHYGRR